MSDLKLQSSKTLFEMAALKWVCSVLAHGVYLHEENFRYVVDAINIIGRRLNFNFDYSCFYLEALECVLLKCVSHIRPGFTQHWFVSTYQIRSALTDEAYRFGLGKEHEPDTIHTEYAWTGAELWDGSELNDSLNAIDKVKDQELSSQGRVGR